MTDSYTDEIIAMGIDSPSNLDRMNIAILVSIMSCFRPNLDKELIQRKESISLKKFLAEASLEETKNILGWIINIRTFRIYIREVKKVEWMNMINKVLDSKNIPNKLLEKLVGVLNHIGFIIPTSRYFINRIRYLQIVIKY